METLIAVAQEIEATGPSCVETDLTQGMLALHLKQFLKTYLTEHLCIVFLTLKKLWVWLFFCRLTNRTMLPGIHYFWMVDGLPPERQT
jgi:hypothetical protein